LAGELALQPIDGRSLARELLPQRSELLAAGGTLVFCLPLEVNDSTDPLAPRCQIGGGGVEVGEQPFRLCVLGGFRRVRTRLRGLSLRLG